MNSIAICIVVSGHYKETKYCIENLLKKADSDVKLYILLNGNNCSKLRNYLIELCDKNDWYIEETYEYKSLPISVANNILLKQVKEKYCCIFPLNLLVGNGWLMNLFCAMYNCEKTGIASIRNGEENVELLPLLHKSPMGEDILKNVWSQPNGLVNGLLFFKTELLETIGYFDEITEIPALESAELSFRFAVQGLSNYYIMNHTAVRIPINNSCLFPEQTENSGKNLRKKIESIIKQTNQIYGDNTTTSERDTDTNPDTDNFNFTIGSVERTSGKSESNTESTKSTFGNLNTWP